jgi:hypothetical protein
MAIDQTGKIQVHVHLPGAGWPVAAHHEHVHLYLHVAATADDVQEATEPGPRSRPLLKMAGIICLIGLSGMGAAWMSHRLAGTGTGATPATTRQQASASDEATESAIPPALAQQLARPPRVIPPPGGNAAPAAPSGPAVFGLKP